MVAIAQEASQLIDTAASVLARCGLTIVDINLAQPSRHTRNTHAREVGNSIATRRTLRTRIALTFVDIDTTVFSTITRRTYTLEIVFLVHALSVILARMAQALVHIQIAIQTGIARGAEAPERTGRILADTVHTDLILGLALIDIVFTSLAFEAGRTFAHVVLALGVTRSVV